MKKLIALLGLVPFMAFGQTNITKLAWDWTPTPEELGGMTLSDYETNIVFNIYSSTNVTTPLTNWAKAKIVAGNLRTATVPWSGKTTFYVATAEKLSSGLESSFSNGVVDIANPRTGVLRIAKP